MEAALVFFLAVALLGLAVAIVLSVRLRCHISSERVRAIDDPAKLYPNLIPPKAVLTDRGRILRRYMIMGVVAFAGSLALLAALSQLGAARCPPLRAGAISPGGGALGSLADQGSRAPLTGRRRLSLAADPATLL